MSSSFSQLLRNSRLSKFDPKLSQVYKTYGEYQKLGDYGVKRNLPNYLRTNVVTINEIDTIEHQTPYNSAETLIRFKRKWKENFLISKTAEPLKSNDIYQRNFINISKLSLKDFKKLLKKIEKRKYDWNQLLINSTYDSNNWLEFLGLTFTTKSSNSIIKGLTYSHNNPGINFEVQGRVLNKDSNGIFAIGISGLVGSLHYGKAQRRLVQVNRKKLDNFYLEKVDFDDQGRPNIRVSHSPILTYQNDFNLLDNYPGKNSLFFDSATNRVKDNEKTQEEILTRLRSLLKTSGDSTTSSDVEPSSKPSFQLVYEEMFSSNTKEEGGEKNNKNLLEILSENKESTKNNSIKVEGGEKNGKNLFEGLGNRNIRVDECFERYLKRGEVFCSGVYRIRLF
ncbi:unnamed protein product [Rhizophagus irregularis]|uniref:Uncharacterized protein n=1 Tax=Rhizophagus irregularis TaxID=588596 RepID=A0A916EG02_9GLOM|nr:unnamed protein product [Rhizophagus irregularis]CAB5379636.1 unnamed protein product [Rhizophagus irregularis]